MQEARRLCADVLRAHRALRNREDGYWCLDPTGAGLPHARRAAFPVRDCRSVFACSDGFSQLIGFGVASSLQELHREVKKSGFQALYQTLWDLQEKDGEMIRLPRFKLRDDASAGLMIRTEED